jgi:diguanylate cyclase (GGDEF)-like protein/PAS domain S-box-containing protein
MLASAARSLVVEDARANPAFATRPATEALGIGAYSGVSLRRAAGQLYGTLCTLNSTARSAHPGETELLALAGALIMQVVDREALRAVEQRQLRDLADHAADLRRIAEVSAAVAAQTDLGATLDHIVRAAARSAGLQHLSILMLDAQGRTLTHAASVELPAAYIAAIDGVAIGPEVGTCGAAAYHGETVITEDLCVDPAWDAYRHLALPCGFRAVWSAPLIARQGRVLGTLAAYQTRRGRPTENQQEVLELYARLAAVAVENARAEAALRASEQSFAQLFAQSPQPMWVYDRQSFAFLEVNEAAVAHYGYMRDEFLGMTVRDIRPPEDVARFQDSVKGPRASSLRQSPGVRHRLKDGRLIDVDIASHELPFAGHDADLIIAYDVTERTRIEQELRQGERRKSAILETALDAIVTMDHQGIVLEWNAAADATFGYSRAEAIGRELAGLIIPPATREEHRHGLARVLAAGEGTLLGRRAEMTAIRADGVEFPVELAVGQVAGEDPPLYTAYIRDISERKRATERLTRQALHDALTDLPNRVLLQDRLARELAVVARSGASIALLLLDLDGFKEINDTLGHTVGDLLLRQVGARLCGALRAGDTVARLGGDEFAALLPGADEDGARAVAHTIIEALDAPFVVEGQGLRVGGSLGIALAPAHGTDADGLLRRADVAMYAAKRTGGAAFYDPAWDAYGPLRLTIMNDLRQAIAADGLVLHYQPKVDLATGRVAGVEALVRWPHAAHGLIPPDQFIPLAEQSGVIVPLTVWVLETALRQGQAWLAAGHKFDVAVNLSARALREAALPETVERLLVTYGVAPAALTLEITESALMTDPTTALAVLRRLAACGVRLSIDDFGTGYSSLAYLKNLPVDEVKVDKSFVRGLGPRAEARDFAIVAAVLGMARSLGLDVVAEGVETESEWATLSGLRCDTVQGYLVSRPLPAPALDEWLRTLEGGRVAPYWIGAKIA